ncbi:phosphate ABC transporter substrate-binding protein [Haloferax sp. Atlit-47N]|uniref:PstS family phosphate ABC transporter substrate-binding protein n=1 Tax=Haloferax sp. Atlit-48N TaxID=2077198 RepID=A0ACD5HUA7_9EURY|nr:MULTISPECIES: PstS family phosphate ABC transporter substrate-binding protein [unclassified Haloferax]ELK55900.1 putative phosphate ABC transporter periplasmic substrate-binding protein [Haloferax sp. BAB-2207]MBC9987060.1 PstS family phosphate ABC transporter substrate-binding protein [Haloferax sp. AS1]RDZ31408.1 phosphate ABC transporter substrate-binding protein PstS family protein [Haloferax sp. Atlit-48N]RDZ38737.1 phosphate ABC transporter substrate-binding protein [Haloferax sp. Atli
MTRNSDSVLSRRKFLIASGAAGLAGLAGCTENNTGGEGGSSDGGSGGDSEGTDSSGDGSNELSGTIDIAGSSTVFPLATAMGERFQSEHSEVNINLQSTGSGGGFANYFCTGQTDFNNASRPIKGEEETQCEDNDVTPVELKVATDALTVIVNNDNDFLGEGLTVEQLQTIFSAESTPTTWSDVNSEWPDEEIEIYGPTDASGTYDYFIEAIIGEEGPGHRQDYSATEQDRTIIQGVEGSEYAIGYLGFAYYSENTDAVQAVAIENDAGEFVEPSLDTALSGEYNPLSRPLFTYPARESLAEDHVAEFARYWMENSTSREIVADEVGYVPLGEDEQQEMLDTLNAAIEEAN